MIRQIHIDAWREVAPWRINVWIEQDLLISRAPAALYGSPVIADSLAFREAAALYTLHIPPACHLADIDLVQIRPGPIGSVTDAIREAPGSWLGKPHCRKKKRAPSSVSATPPRCRPRTAPL